jgi:ferrous iron transport protein B
MKEENIIVLAGNPNCGKSSLFNQLTGLNQRITNISGTTIENKVGKLSHNGKTYQILDTPGTYSLKPKSPDEIEAVKIFENPTPDIIIYVADAGNLRRNLFYFAQLAQKKIPMILVLSMADMAEKKGISTQVDRLEKELGIPVIIENLRLDSAKNLVLEKIENAEFTPHYSFSNNEQDDAEEIYRSIDQLLSKVQTKKSLNTLLSEKWDKYLTHPIYGSLFLIFTLLIIFQLVFSIAEYPMEWIESGMNYIGEFFVNVLPDNWATNLLVNGVLAGVTGVIIFIPQIAFLFLFMSILEDSGYLARISLITDKIMRAFGLNGKSVVPLISGMACAIPAIMGARSIENWKERLITILVTPLMVCSARLPVYTILISLIVPSESTWLGIRTQAWLLLGLYFIGTFAALAVALVFKYLLTYKVPSFFIMEMPLYQFPRWKNVFLTSAQKSWQFVTEAGKIILLISIILWFLASFSPENGILKPKATNEISQSYAGRLGKTIEPVIAPLGYDWKIGIALITSFAAREVFVGTVSTIYSVESEEQIGSIRAKMAADKKPDGSPVYSLATVLSLLVFYAFAMQCMSTLAVVYKETNTWKWPALQLLYMTGMAYVASFIVYQIFN